MSLPLTAKVKAETPTTNVPEYMDLLQETIGFFTQYKNKTIINNTVLYNYDLKYSVYENGQKHVITNDFDKLRYMKFMGVYNDGSYSICDKLPGMPIYRADLNTYKFEFVKNAPLYSKEAVNFNYYLMDNNGNFWFSGIAKNPVVTHTQDGEQYYNKYIVYSDNGFSFETLQPTTDYGNVNFSRPLLGYDGNVWFYKSSDNGEGTKVYMVSADKQLHELDVNPGGAIEQFRIGSNGNVYMDVTAKSGTSSVTTIKQYKYANGKLEYVKQYNQYGWLAIDCKGTLWYDDNHGSIYKLEDDNFVKKYKVNSIVTGLQVYDDNHMVLGGHGGNGLIIISKDSTTPTPTAAITPTPTAAATPTASPTPSPSPSTAQPTAAAPEKFTTTVDNASKSATININSSLVSKDSVNEIAPALSDDVTTYEAKLDAPTVNGGAGSLKLSASNVTMELPFGTVDYDGCSSGSYVSIKQRALLGDSTLGALKSIGRAYDFSLATFTKDGTKLKDIHNFKSGKAKLTIKLSSEDIKNLDTSKLAAFYYNETTGLWENLGGTFDKDAMTFNFETTHFSKCTIAQIPETLPQTGSIISFDGLMLLAGISLLCGIILIFTKRRTE